jgi:hypothetical protein
MLYCEICNKKYHKCCWDDHLKSKTHMNYLNFHNPNKLVGMNSFVYLCESCNVVVRVNSKYSHERTKIHLRLV